MMAKALGDEAFRTRLREHGLKQAKKFSWDESARRAITAFEGIYSAKTRDSKVEESENKLPQLIAAIAAIVPSRISEKETIKIAHVLSRNHHVINQKQLFVDISELVQRDARSVVQCVTRSILKELLKNPPEGYVVEPVYATRSSLGYRYARHFTANFRGIINDRTDEPIEYHPGDIFLGLDLQHQVVIAQKEYLSSIRRDGVKIFLVVHDLLSITFPQHFLPGMDACHKEWLLTIADFDGAICISRTVSGELKEWLAENGPKRLREFKISWSHNGADAYDSVSIPGLVNDAKSMPKELMLRPTFLTVGTVEPRKCHAQTLDAFGLLWKQGVDANFVIVGKQGWLVETLAKRLRRHYELNKRLFWLEGISDEYLEKIYAASTCLIAASEGEGFGLPLIEAARHKLSIIARDIPVFREVAGEHAFYFKGIEPQALSEAILQWIELDELGKSPRSDNMPWLTWKQSAERLKQIIIEDDW